MIKGQKRLRAAQGLPEYYNSRDVMAMVRITSRQTLSRYIADNKVPRPIKMTARQLLWPKHEFDEFMANKRATEEDA